MIFPADPEKLPRHPSQLYEAALEGLVTFVILFALTWKFRLLQRPGAAFGLFFTLYSLSRIFVENFREPDAFMPDFPIGLTMGMMLSTPMLAIGLFLLWRAFRTPAPKAADAQ